MSDVHKAEVHAVREGEVHETFVNLDKQLKADDPDAVQVPENAGEHAKLPIHATAGKTVEEVFTAEEKPRRGRKAEES